jgi:H/ACA ribonucleoprotein complex subunit 2
VIIAGDIQPIDVITHLPVLCEDSGVPYIYVPSKEDLGLAGSTKRPTSCVLIPEGADYKEVYDEVFSEVSALNATLISV